MHASKHFRAISKLVPPLLLLAFVVTILFCVVTLQPSIAHYIAFAETLIKFVNTNITGV